MTLTRQKLKINRVRNVRVDLTPHVDLIKQLYVEQCLSATTVCKLLKEHTGRFVSGTHLFEVLDALGIRRTMKDELRKKNRYPRRTCKGCQSTFQPAGATTRYCLTCYPNREDGSRCLTHGITHAQFQALLDSQNHACAICQKRFDELSCRRFPANIDHDHKTGKIRGLLCNKCNVSLGHFESLDQSRVAAYLASEGIEPVRST